MDESIVNPHTGDLSTPNEELSKFCALTDEVPTGLSEIALKRREQILDATEAIIAREGIHRLSLGHIEKSLGGMSRGQLTYYFPNKESILLAVFRRMLRRMVNEVMRSDGPKPMTGQAWNCFQHALGRNLDTTQPAGEQDLFSLYYTFLAQMNHRADYRDQMAQLLREGRTFIANDFAGSVSEPRPVSPSIVSALIQALFNGLRTQLAVDPNAFDRSEMSAACVQIFAPLFLQNSTHPQPNGVSP